MQDPTQDDQQKIDPKAQAAGGKDNSDETKEPQEKEEDETSKPTSEAEEKDGKIEELKNALARSMADLQNFKRRNEEEKGSFVRFANGELLRALLPFVDNLERSVNHLPESLKDDTWAKGIVHIQADLLKTLDSLGVKKIKCVGEKLNPEKHEGLMSGPGEKDVIIEEFEPGYLLGDMVIKVAKVKVGDGSKK